MVLRIQDIGRDETGEVPDLVDEELRNFVAGVCITTKEGIQVRMRRQTHDYQEVERLLSMGTVIRVLWQCEIDGERHFLCSVVEQAPYGRYEGYYCTKETLLQMLS